MVRGAGQSTGPTAMGRARAHERLAGWDGVGAAHGLGPRRANADLAVDARARGRGF